MTKPSRSLSQGREAACGSSLRVDMAFMAEKRFDATKVHTHTFPMSDLPEALRYARERVDDAIKVVVSMKDSSAKSAAAE